MDVTCTRCGKTLRIINDGDGIHTCSPQKVKEGMTADRIKELVPEFDSWYGANETEAILMMPGTRTGKIVDKIVFQALLTTRAEVERLRKALEEIARDEGPHTWASVKASHALEKWE